MFPSFGYAVVFCLMISTGSSRGKPNNSKQSLRKTTKMQEKQSFVVNNNCGLGQNERQTLSLIKEKVHEIAANIKNESACSTGWVQYGKSCYIVIDISTAEWSAARRNCLRIGGDLAKITSNHENQFVNNLIGNQVYTTNHGVWLGLHLKADNKFYWTDGTLLAGYNNWYPGQPSHPSTEKCAQLYGKSSRGRGKWNDIPCTWNVSRPPVILCQKALK
ncbi:perlucin-like protein isoform X1 [Acropora millepora]|uniref:perlucin-like protein isoform X1 n=1 Tax=Acropora millepora TaxID=45264 RepID=UPI001CF5ED29|nr:perlucin-like protein isoform X1 [Acropora millepora]